MGDRTPAAGPARLTEEQVAAIEERAEVATTAPWYPFVSPWPDKMHVVTAVDEAGPPIAYIGNKLLGGPANDANLQFIAASRTDVPALLAALRAAWAEQDDVRAALRRLAEWCQRGEFATHAVLAHAHGFRASAESVAEAEAVWAQVRAALAAPGAGEETTA